MVMTRKDPNKDVRLTDNDVTIHCNKDVTIRLQQGREAE